MERQHHRDEMMFLTGRCKKSDILALNNDGQEQDVIVFPERVHETRLN